MSRSYPWQDRHASPLPIPSLEERAEVAAALKAYTASLPRRGTPERELEERVHLPDCAECFDVGVARCGEHGLLLFRRAAVVAQDAHGAAPAAETPEKVLESSRNTC